MNKFIIYILTIGLPVIVVLCSINILITPNYIYKCNYMDSVIIKAREGYNTTDIDANMDERLFKKKYAEFFHGKNIDYIILGSSRMMPISTEAVNNKSVLNLSISGAEIEDLIAIYQVSLDNRIKSHYVIIGVDPLFFNPKYGGGWWKTIAEYYFKFMNVKYDGGYESLANRLFSIDYFRLAVSSIQTNGFEDNNTLHYVKEYINKGYTRRIDGSIYYPENFRNRNLKEIDQIACDFDINEYDFEDLDTERKKLFEQLCDSILNHGESLIYVCCPYHPIMYDRISKYGCINKTEEYVHNMSKKNKAMIIGSFNPATYRYTNKDFYDATHPKKEMLDTLLKDSLLFESQLSNFRSQRIMQLNI